MLLRGRLLCAAMILSAAAGFTQWAAPASRRFMARPSLRLAAAALQPRRLPLVVARSVVGVGGGDAAVAKAEFAAIATEVTKVGDEIRALKAAKATKEV